MPPRPLTRLQRKIDRLRAAHPRLMLWSVRPAVPPGHFYSPIVDPAGLRDHEEELWPASAPDPLGIDFRPESHERILLEDFPRYIGDYDYPETPGPTSRPYDFHTRNPQFSWLDARAAFVLLRKWRPTRIVEVGSGYSSLLMADVNRRFLDGRTDITCIEPYPRGFLAAGVPGIAALVTEKVQRVPLAVFESLGPGDVLFIDSSHVAKTGSDVNHLYFEVLPRLSAGVHVHVHDVFLPGEYPKEWVLRENRSWNEQYVLRALLMHSSAFRVVFGCAWAFARMPGLVARALSHPKGHAFGGGSFWMDRA